jgi:hypothetical protein
MRVCSAAHESAGIAKVRICASQLQSWNSLNDSMGIDVSGHKRNDILPQFSEPSENSLVITDKIISVSTIFTIVCCYYSKILYDLITARQAQFLA